MKVALVHDYLKEYGGAERVLEVLSDMYPDAPIYTAFAVHDSKTYKSFKDKKIVTSFAQYIPFFSKLYSPLRFLAPIIWKSFDFKDYDLVISSSSWYVTKGFRKGEKTVEICYCHTPPRWLYGYNTSVEWQRYRIVKLYALIVGNFMRTYDYNSAQKVSHFIANSEEVSGRIKKFYRRSSTVIYPPVSLPKVPKVKKEDYYFVLSRIVGGKGLEIAVDAAEKMGFKLKIAGTPFGYYTGHKEMIGKKLKNVEFLGHVTDEKLVKLYAGAKAFLALAKDEDFGITPVESMLCGTPVIAFNGGGYKETVVDGKTGILFDNYSSDGLVKAINKFEKMKFSSEACKSQAEKFSKERFEKEFKEFVKTHAVED